MPFVAPATQDANSGVVPIQRPTFAQLYTDHFDSVWRAARRMGIADESLDDVVQEVFVAAYKRLSSFECRSSVKTWLLGITVHCVQRHRRTTRRKSPHALERRDPTDPETLGSGSNDPQELALRAEAARAVREILDDLDDEKRAVFVLAELENLTAPEIADALVAPVNTIYSRLRLARKDFAEAAARYRARDQWRRP